MIVNNIRIQLANADGFINVSNEKGMLYKGLQPAAIEWKQFGLFIIPHDKEFHITSFCWTKQ
jgi:hypothetical protein